MVSKETVIIWDNGHSRLQYCVVDGDRRHLDRVYLNKDFAAKLTIELSDLMFDPVSWRIRQQMLDDFPRQAVVNGAYVICAGIVS